jgi:hypothetical protein
MLSLDDAASVPLLRLPRTDAAVREHRRLLGRTKMALRLRAVNVVVKPLGCSLLQRPATNAMCSTWIAMFDGEARGSTLLRRTEPPRRDELAAVDSLGRVS